jgi:signal transduction histidine kinase
MTADIEAALALVRPQADTKSIELTNECTADPAPYIGDASRVRQILVNLLSNAVKFSNAEARVWVACGKTSERPQSAALSSDPPWLFVAVTDTGIGIAADQLEAVFHPFVQASTGKTRTHGGTGLGLSISRQLARLMNGDITVRSELGAGSTFTLWLPCPDC